MKTSPLPRLAIGALVVGLALPGVASAGDALGPGDSTVLAHSVRVDGDATVGTVAGLALACLANRSVAWRRRKG